MPYTKQTWKDHLVERPRTYREVTNADGTKTLNPDYGAVTQAGTPVDAAHLNHMEDGIAAAQAGVDELSEWKETLDVAETTAAAQQAISDAQDAIEAVEQAAASVPQDYTALSATVQEQGADIAELKEYGHQIYTGGPNGSMTALGLTVSNTGRLYNISGTGSTNNGSGWYDENMLVVSVLDGCVPWENRVNTLQLKAGHTYRFSMRSTKFPQNYDDDVVVQNYAPFALVLQAASATSKTARKVILANPGASPNPSVDFSNDGSCGSYYCTQDEEVRVMLFISPGRSNQYYKYNSVKILIGISDCTNNETMPIYGTNSDHRFNERPINELRVRNIKLLDDHSLTQPHLQKLWGFSDQGKVPNGSLTFSENDGSVYLSEADVARIKGSLPRTGQLQTGTGSATGQYAVATGQDTAASGTASSAHGDGTIANHLAQHVFGEYNAADTSEAAATQRGDYVEIVGNGTPSGERSNARTLDWSGNEALAGDLTIRKGKANEESLGAHFPGSGCFEAGTGTSGGAYSSAEGYETVADGTYSHAEGYKTYTKNGSGMGAHAEGGQTAANGSYSHAEGYKTTAGGMYSHAEGANTTTSQASAHAEGSNTAASGVAGHAEGHGSQATAEAAHAEGCARASGRYAHAEGDSALASGHASHAEGAIHEVESDGAVEEHITTASGKGSHAEGSGTRASGVSAHAEGAMTEATGESAHAEGSETVASGDGAHAEGQKTEATGYYSHAEGVETAAHALAAHAEGLESWAIGWYSHAQGQGTTAKNRSQHVMGEFNEDDPSSASSNERGMYAEIVGNGTSDTARSNARTLDWSGNETLAGTLTANGVNLNEAVEALQNERHMGDYRIIKKTRTAATPVMSGSLSSPLITWNGTYQLVDMHGNVIDEFTNSSASQPYSVGASTIAYVYWDKNGSNQFKLRLSATGVPQGDRYYPLGFIDTTTAMDDPHNWIGIAHSVA